MTGKYYPPQYEVQQFHCPFCQVFAKQNWYPIKVGSWKLDLEASRCTHCDKWAIWSTDGTLIMPIASSIPMPSLDLPDDCTGDYMEARTIFPASPRASAALLRLCIQKLMPALGESGKNINDDIKSLVKKGLSPLTQKALDVCRVVGNNAVHPGEISAEDTAEIASNLFGLINFIVEDRITRPREIEALYEKLPESARTAIEKRDGS